MWHGWCLPLFIGPCALKLNQAGKSRLFSALGKHFAADGVPAEGYAEYVKNDSYQRLFTGLSHLNLADTVGSLLPHMSPRHELA